MLDAGDAIGDRDTGQTGATIERPRPDAGHAMGNRDLRQAGAVRKRPTFDAGDRQAIDHAGYDDVTHRAVTVGNADRAVVGRVRELGSHRGGKQQQEQEVPDTPGGSRRGGRCARGRRRAARPEMPAE